MSLSSRARGIVCILLSVLCFYLGSLPIRWAKSYGDLGGGEFIFFRFLVGSFAVCVYQLWQGSVPRPDGWQIVLGRVIFHFLAGWLYYLSIAESSAAFGNVLHMTYPLFAALIVFTYRPTKSSLQQLIVSTVGVSGVALTLELSEGSNWAVILGLLSGIAGAFSVLLLSSSRKLNSTMEIFFFTFLGGLILSFFVGSPQIEIHSSEELWLLLASAGLGIAGQISFTYGAAYIASVEAGVLSCLRIPCAMLGATVGLDTSTATVQAWMGAMLVLLANIWVIRNRQATPELER